VVGAAKHKRRHILLLLLQGLLLCRLPGPLHRKLLLCWHCWLLLLLCGELLHCLPEPRHGCCLSRSLRSWAAAKCTEVCQQLSYRLSTVI
jgi:hypothetical protein